MIKKVIVEASECECELCHYRWISLSVKLPESCRNRDCRSREWNGKKKRIRATKSNLPKPKKVRQGEDDGYDF